MPKRKTRKVEMRPGITITYKVKHGLNLSRELRLAKQIAQFAIENRDKLSSKYVRHLGLQSELSNPILWKYGRNKAAKRVHNVKLEIKARDVKRKDDGLWLSPLKAFVPFRHEGKFAQIQADETYLYVPIETAAHKPRKTTRSIGVDLNTTGFSAVAAIPETGKVFKLGKGAKHTHEKYRDMRRNFQKAGKLSVVKKLKTRESDIARNLNHQTSRKIVNLAVKNRAHIYLENLSGIKGRAVRKAQRYTLHSWGFHQLKRFIAYKALLAGVPVTYVEPAYTSRGCSRCGLVGTRAGKSFKCPNGHAAHADVNAAFLIASPELAQSVRDSVLAEGNTGIPQMATS